MTKLRSASRYGARYSSPLKQIVQEIEKVQKVPQLCPQCGRKSLKRFGYAIWRCKKCGFEMAGGAYHPRTEIGITAEKIVKKEIAAPAEEVKEEEGAEQTKEEIEEKQE